MAKKVRYAQPLLGEANAAGYLIAVPGASVLIRQNGVACSVFADEAGTAMTNPVPTGVPQGTAGVDTEGTLLVYLTAGSGYDALATVGLAASTFAIPTISPHVDDVSGPIPAGTYAGTETAGVAAVALDKSASLQTKVGALVLQPSGTHGQVFIGPQGTEPDGRAPYSLMPGEQCIRLTMTDPRAGEGHTLAGPVDFYIGPYVGATPIGMAIEFKGIVETWTEDWSCHGNNRGGTGTPTNPHFWVCDGMDDGALLVTCHSELDMDPRTKWARIASISSLGTKGVGPIQLVLRDTLDYFSWATTTHARAETITEVARLSSVGRLQLGQGVVGSATAVRLHLGDPGGTAFRLQDTNNPSGGATSFTQAGQTLTLNTYDGAGTFTGTPLSVTSARVAFATTAKITAAGELLLGMETLPDPGARATIVSTNSGQVALQLYGRTNTVDILQVNDLVTGTLWRVNKAGYPMFRNAATPLLADMVNGEGALWVDAATGYAKVTTRTSGALKQITLADDLARLGATQTWTKPQRLESSAVGETPLTVRGFTGQTSPLLNVENVGGVTLTRIDNSGLLSIRPWSGGASPVAASAFIEAPAAANPVLVVQGIAAQTGDLQAWRDNTPAILSRIGKGGRFMTRVNSAPADADVATGEAALWFDSTNGAAKLMVKAKQADGTVVAGSVALA